MSQTPSRKPHVVLNLASRQHKGEKIRRLLDLQPDGSTKLRILEIGTGSGGIAHYLASQSEHFHVHAVDVVDNRLITEGYQFRMVSDTQLPFDDGYFDIVISNHVIEHVGEAAQQLEHLNEIRRILSPAGKGYLAVPNRWMLVEPHYRLAFLSYLPRSLRSPYLRLCGKGQFYDCEPLSRGELERMLAQANFDYTNLCAQALKLTLVIEQPGSLADRLAERTPTWLINHFASIIPTLIYRISKKG